MSKSGGFIVFFGLLDFFEVKITLSSSLFKIVVTLFMVPISVFPSTLFTKDEDFSLEGFFI